MENETIIAGWPHVALSRNEFAKLMLKDCINNRAAEQKNTKLAFSMNGQALSLAEYNGDFKSAMKAADYIQADGQSLVFASKLFSKKPLPERIATTDFFHDAAKIAEDNGLRFYLLGAKEDVIEKTVENIKKKYPGLILCGYRNGYFELNEEQSVCEEIVRSNADVLWIGLGKPAEQYFCIRNREKLASIGWIKTCGGLFDFLSGNSKRAPLWMQQIGMEWFYRLVLEPKRLFFRYFTSNIHCLWLIVKNKNRLA